jgi:hypothetical protein
MGAGVHPGQGAAKRCAMEQRRRNLGSDSGGGGGGGSITSRVGLSATGQRNMTLQRRGRLSRPRPRRGSRGRSCVGQDTSKPGGMAA